MAMCVVGNGVMRRVQWTIRTTDGSAVSLQWCDLTAVGSGVYFNGNIVAQQDNAERAFVQTYIGTADTNAIGTGTGLSVSVGPNGYIDTATAPWTTFAAPVGWNAQPHDLAAAPIVSFTVQGAAGQNIDWLVDVNCYFWGGAVLLIV